MLLLCLLLLPAGLLAENGGQLYVPEQLAPWVQWVKQKDPEFGCVPVRNRKVCEWPGKLILELNSKGGRFEFSGVLDRDKGELDLPGGVAGPLSSVWPQDVSSRIPGAKKPVAVLSRNSRPEAVLPRGPFALEGTFSWQQLPEQIRMPEGVGLLFVSIDGKPIPNIRPDAGGALLLREPVSSAVEEADSISWQLFRRLEDGLPFKIQTHVDLRVSGKPRELQVGNLVPAGAVITGIRASLAYRLLDENRLSLQARAGTHYLRLESMLPVPPPELGASFADLPGGAGQEVWSWAANSVLRAVELSGAPGIDPGRTSMPQEWRALPAYVLTPGSRLVFRETRRGLRELPPNRLQIARTLWLDQSGGGFSVRDQISAGMQQGWRINAAAGLVPGRATVNGEESLLTADPSSKVPGLELRSEWNNVVVESRIEGAAGRFSASGWLHDVDSLSAVLKLPPGWRLLGASGADNLSGSWIGQWSLFDFFLVLLVGVASAKIFGWFWGAVACLALVICHAEGGAPLQIWFYLLAGRALVDNLPSGALRRAMNWIYLALLGALVVVLIPFSISQIRQGLFPQLGLDNQYSEFEVLAEAFSALLRGGLGTMAVAALLVAAVALLFKKRFRAFFGTLAAIVVVLMLQSIMPGSLMRARVYRDHAPSEAPAPAMAPAPLQRQAQSLKKDEMADKESLEVAEEDSAAGMLEGGMAPAPSRERRRQMTEELKKIDPNAVIQTGPGLPRWEWSSWQLSWNGPVSPDQQARVYLAGPLLNLLFSVLRVALLVLFAVPFFRRLEIGGWRLSGSAQTAAAAVLITALLLQPATASAQAFPDQQLLSDLQNRLQEQQCRNDCVACPRLRLSVEDSAGAPALQIEAELHSQGGAGWALPGPLDQFMPESVRIDGVEHTAIRRDASGVLWVKAPEGVHKLTVKGRALRPDVINLQFPIPPGVIEVNAPGWNVEGISPTGSLQGALQLMRVIAHAPAAGTSAPVSEAAEQELPSWYMVRRSFDISLPWQVQTTVQRIGGTRRAESLRVPLAGGEVLTSPETRVEQGMAVISFAPGATRQSWTGRLSEDAMIELSAPALPRMSEAWDFRCSEMWQCRPEGLPAVSSVTGGQHVLSFVPWPGDKMRMSVSRPPALAGRTTTIERAALTFSPGERLLQGTLEFTARSSQGSSQRVTLPEGAKLESLMIDGRPRALNAGGSGGRDVIVQIESGTKNYLVGWKMPWKFRVLDKMPEVDLGSDAVNYSISVSIPRDRWLLWLGGPAWGPAVLFWSKLLFVILAAMIIGSWPITPLGRFAWLMVGLGLASLPVAAMLIPVVWLLVLGWRRNNSEMEKGRFNAVQIVIVILTAGTFMVFFEAVRTGLILYPDMQVMGQGSSPALLYWYQDRVGPKLPISCVISLPIWVWRVLMLLWSFWIVTALPGWLRWGWSSFTSGSIWKRT